MAVTYRCTKLTVTPLKPEFATDEDVLIKVIADVERKSEGVGISVQWCIRIFLDSMVDSIDHKWVWHAPWETIDKETYDATLNFGRHSAGPFTGAIIVSAYS